MKTLNIKTAFRGAVAFIFCVSAASAVFARSENDTCGPGRGKQSPLLCSSHNALPEDLNRPGTSGGAETSPKQYLSHFEYKSEDFDIPIEINDFVWEQVVYLQRNQQNVRNSLQRGAFYMPLMREALFDVGCPQDLFYLAMIESNFSPTARSPAAAAGMWQFIESTGKRYGLKINGWVDQRLDIVESTHAAGLFLIDLYDRFGSWPLALAAYNGGPGAVSKAIKASGSNDFWDIIDGSYLQPETEHFVPKYFGALIIGKYPERFGISCLTAPDSSQYKEISVPPLTDIYLIARLCGANYDEMLKLNAQYLFECTPPGKGPWPVLAPKKNAENLEEKINMLYPEERNAFMHYKVRRGESLTKIAQRYKIESNIIMEANYLKSAREIRAGDTLMIPIRRSGPIAMPVPAQTRAPNIKRVNGKYSFNYTVGSGDTLWQIAKSVNVSVDDLCKWNDLSRKDSLRPGQEIIIYCENYGTAWSNAKQGEENRRKTLFTDAK